jgi:putative membrane protein
VLSALVSALHLLALPIGLPAVFFRSRILRGTLDRQGLQRLFAADTLWGVAAVLWIATGLYRAFGGLEKGAAFYLGSRLFWVKMALLVAILALEIGPMTAFIRWRRQVARGEQPDTARARTYAAVGHAEMALGVLMVLAAAFMARGFGSG